MPKRARLVWIPALLLLLPLAASAETFTVTLDNGMSFLTRYQPRISPPDESKVMLLTQTGNWISLPLDRVVEVTNDTESRGFGRVIDTTTISLGFAPNEYGEPEEASAVDSATRLLQYMTARDAAQQDYSVDQFVDTESAGVGGFPTSYGAGSTFGSSTGFAQPGPSLLPVPSPPDNQ